MFVQVKNSFFSEALVWHSNINIESKFYNSKRSRKNVVISYVVCSLSCFFFYELNKMAITILKLQKHEFWFEFMYMSIFFTSFSHSFTSRVVNSMKYFFDSISFQMCLHSFLTHRQNINKILNWCTYRSLCIFFSFLEYLVFLLILLLILIQQQLSNLNE